MRLKSIAALAFCCILFSENLSFAATVKAYSGKCAEPSIAGNWTVVLTFNDDGQVTRREGIRCDGTHWVDACPKVGIATPPDRPSGYYTELTHGAWVRFNATAEGQITEIWGRDVNGDYWEGTTGTTPSGDLSEVNR